MYDYQLPSSLAAHDSRPKTPDTQALQNQAQKILYQRIKNSHEVQHSSDWTTIINPPFNHILFMAVSPCGIFVVFAKKQSIQILNIPKNLLEPYLETSDCIKSLYFSPNGLYLLCGYQKIIEIFDFKQKTLNSTIPMSSDKSFTAILTADGKYVAYPDKTSINFWSFFDKKEEFRLNGHEKAVMSIACSANGKFIISGSSDLSIILWNYEIRREEFKLLTKQKQITTVKISDDGRYAASIFKSTVTVWNLDIRSEVFSLKFDEKIHSFPFSPDNQTLAISSAYEIKFFSIKNRCKERIFNEKRFGSKVNFSPDGKILIGSEICLWKISKIPKQIIFDHNLQNEYIKYILFTNNGKYVGLFSYSQGLRIFNIKKKKIEFTFRNKKKKIDSIQVSVDGNYLVIVEEERNLSIFNLKTGEVIFSITDFYCKFYTISKDFSLFGLCTESKCFSVWSVMKNLEIFKVETNNMLYNVPSFSNDCRFVALRFIDDYIEVWNIESRRKEYSFMKLMKCIESIYFTKDDLSIIIVGSGPFRSITHIWSILSKTLVFTIDSYQNIWINEDYIITEKLKILNFWNIKGKFKELSIYCESIPYKILYNGKRLSLFYDSYCDIWKIQDYLKVKCNNNSKLYSPICFSKNKKFAVSGDENVLKLWNVDKEKEILSFKAHKNWIRTLCFSHDSQFILSGDDDGCVKIWDLNGKEIHCFIGHSSWVITAAFSIDDRFVVSGSNDRIVILWEVGRYEELKTFEVFEKEIKLLSFTRSGKFIVVQPVEGDLRVLKV